MTLVVNFILQWGCGVKKDLFERNRMFKMKRLILVLLIGILSGYTSYAKEFSILHHFEKTNNSGYWPLGSLVAQDSVFFGVTVGGGENEVGTVYKINKDGSGYVVLHSFRDDSVFADGSYPQGTLVRSGRILYGVTHGKYNKTFGTIYKINVDGSGYEVIHKFSDSKSDGKHPQASLVKSGDFLYGITLRGGQSDSGTVYRINTSGGDFKILHSFMRKDNDGYLPYSSLISTDSLLYGTCLYGGSRGGGTIYKLNMDGSDYRVLYQFPLIPHGQPSGELVLSGSHLYGVTNSGTNTGGVFKINTDGTGLIILHTFAFAPSDGRFPKSSLLKNGDYLYSMTMLGGAADTGTIFRIKTDGSDYSILHSFLGSPTDGSTPVSNGLLMYHGYLYGVTNVGGASNVGTIFGYSDDNLKDTCGADAFEYFDFKNTEKIAFNGSAEALESVVRVCPKLSNTIGSIYYKQPVPVICNFYTNFTFRFSEGKNDFDDGSPAGADGLVFIVQATDTKNIGTSGGGLGYSGISNSLAIEIDSYNNGDEFNEDNGSHLAVMSNGKKLNSSIHKSKAELGYTTEIPLLKADLTIYHCMIEYQYELKKLLIWLDTSGEFLHPALVVDSIDLGELFNLIGMNRAYVGFTSSTGTSVENTDLLSWSFCYNQVQPILAVEEQIIEKTDGIMISPNPAFDFIDISVGAGSEPALTGDVRIYNVFGQSINLTLTLSINGEGVRIDVSSLPAGMYFVRIGELVKKFMKI